MFASIWRFLRRLLVDEEALVRARDPMSADASLLRPEEEEKARKERASLETFARSYYHNPYGWIGGIHTESDEIRAVGRAARRRSDAEESRREEDAP